MSKSSTEQNVQKERQSKRIPAKTFAMNVLNGMSLGIVLVLMPAAIFGELIDLLLLDYIPQLESVLQLFRLSNSMMPIAIGVATAMLFKMQPIEMLSVTLAAVGGSGVFTIVEEGFIFSGTGDVINTGLTTALAVLLVRTVSHRMEAYKLIALPALTMGVAGGIGRVVLPYVMQISGFIGQVINDVTVLQPVLMGIILSVIFAILIVSPLSTVGIATAIALSGVGAGTANLGVVAAQVGLTIAAWKENSTGTALAHVIGSPKIQMANTVRKPVIMLPMLCIASILGALGGWLGIEGTPISAGFGLSGLIGPLAAWGERAAGEGVGLALSIILLFIVLPLVLGFLFQALFTYKVKLVEPLDYRIQFDS
jgi:hypothetical protein